MNTTQLKHWQDPVTALLGAWFSVSPWLLKFQDNTPALWSALALGVLLILSGLGATIKPQSWEHWAEGVIGLCAVASPWVLGFAQHAVATRNAVIVGVAAIAIAAWALIERGEVSWPRDGLAH